MSMHVDARLCAGVEKVRGLYGGRQQRFEVADYCGG